MLTVLAPKISNYKLDNIDENTKFIFNIFIEKKSSQQ